MDICPVLAFYLHGFHKLDQLVGGCLMAGEVIKCPPEIDLQKMDLYGLCHDPVNHPSHYQGKKFESIDIIEDFDLGFHLGNAIKYILRAGKKGNKVQDLKKAIWYLERECKKDSSDSMTLPYPSPKGRI